MASRSLLVAGGLLTKYSNKAITLKQSWRLASTAASYQQVVLSMPATKLTVLDNGMRVASEDNGGPTATVGVWIDTGARHETLTNNGVGHFVEHLIFKGTNKRSQVQLEEEVESLGMHLNSYTNRQHTAFFARCFSKDVPRAVEILADIIQNSKFGEVEMEKERSIILDQLGDVAGNEEEVVMDYLHSVAFQGTPLAKSIIGPTKNIQSFTREDLLEYLSTNFVAPRMVVAAAGGVNHDKLTELANTHFKDLKQSGDYIPALPPYCRYTGSEVRVRDDDMGNAYWATAVQGCGYSSPDYIPLLIASNSIGSWDRTSTGGYNVSRSLAKYCADHNKALSFKSFHLCYSDTGLWGTYVKCQRTNAWDFGFEVMYEWMKLCEYITDAQVMQAKNELKTNILLHLDGTTNVCDDIGQQIIKHGRRIPFAEIEAQIDAVDSAMVREVSFRYFFDKCPVQASMGAIEGLVPDYNRLRAQLVWWRV